MSRSLIPALLVVSLATPAVAGEQPKRDARRGELLYSTQCVACHSAQVHWREKKLATDWISLQAQVRRWQKSSGAGWSNEDITEVVQYLNTLYYHYPVPQ
ncbi:MAG TPA: cytochrome c [Gammaproteobacteria bacterium]|nr:cytochrome c [Gammaproteobacteria bacterium]